MATFLGKKRGCVGTIVAWMLAILLCMWFEIDGETEYVWWQGIFHGWWILPNWVISLMIDDWYVEAPHHTVAYAFFWWMGLIFSAVPTVWQIIKNVFKRK